MSEACSVAIKCADDLLIERCIDSIDDPEVSVNAVITPSSQIESILRDREIPFVVTEYGNIAKSAELSVEEAEHDRVIVMDSDAYFEPGAVGLLRTALDTAMVAKPRLDFDNNGTNVSRIIAERRRMFNSRSDFATNPGLALRRSEVKENCGGYVFNPDVRWTEDADLNFRMEREGIGINYVPDAVVRHDPVTLMHELKCAFLYGVGKRLSVEHTPGREPSEEIPQIIRAMVERRFVDSHEDALSGDGIGEFIIASAWRALYLTGYQAQKRLHFWTVAS